MVRSHSRHSKLAYDAPLAVSDSESLCTKGFNSATADARHYQNAQESRSFTIGPMPPRIFLDCFFAATPFEPSSHMLSSTNAFRSVPHKVSSNSQICRSMVKALNRKTTHKSRCPGFVFHTLAPAKPTPRSAIPAPHICCYAEDSMPRIHSLASSRPESGFAELFIEVKTDPSHDFFVDPPSDAGADNLAAHEFVHQPDDPNLVHEAQAALGRHVDYAAEILARQHRSFLFSISMSGSCARLFLWDRAGCIVTESFDIREHPEILCEFLWRFSQTSDVGCGHDVTVEVATPEEELHFKDAVRGHVQLQLSIEGEALEKAILEHYAPGHVAAIHVLPQDCTSAPENIRRFIVSRPVVAPLYLAGRGTRGYWAMDTSDRRVVFIKDTWRNCETMPGREGDLLRHLHDQGVHYIPSVVCHGDVPDCFPEEPRLIASNEYHVTATDEFRTYPWVCQVAGQMVTVYKQAHYRVVLGTVGYGLRNFRDTEELLHSTYDVFTAMREASTKASRIHRDISLGNIVLVREPGRTIRRGYLIDWESSYEVDESGQALIPGRSGTWLFMSQRMLSHVNAYARQTLADDMESLLYVILYPALRWLPHDYPDYELPDLLQRFFEARTEIRGISHGGNHKLANAVCRATTREIDFKDASFQEWLNTVMDYHSPPEPLEEAYAGRWSDPSHLDRYWSEFLQTHQLARNDRLSTCSRASSSPNSVTSTVDEEDRDASSIPSSLGKRREAPNPPSFLSEQLPKRTRRASARRPQQDLEASASRRSLRKRQSATSAQGVATNDHAPLRQRLRRRTAPAHGKQDVIPNDAPSRRGSRRRA